MSKNFNKTKGAANVNSSSEDMVVFDSSTADVIRDESKWDAFQLVGDTNMEEMTHVAEQKHRMSEKEMQKVLDRGLAFRMGQKIQMMFEAA